MTPQTKQLATHDCTCCGQDLRLPSDTWDRLRLAEQVCEQVAALIKRGAMRGSAHSSMWRRLRDYVAEWEKIS